MRLMVCTFVLKTYLQTNLGSIAAFEWHKIHRIRTDHAICRFNIAGDDSNVISDMKIQGIMLSNLDCK